MISNNIKFNPDENTDYLADLPLVLNSMSLFFPEGDTISSPSQHKYYELTYVVYGELTYIVDGEIYKLKQGSTIVLWPGIKHSYKVMKECEVACVYFSLDYQIDGGQLEISDMRSKRTVNKEDTNNINSQSKLNINYESDGNIIFKNQLDNGKPINKIVVKGKGKEEIASLMETIIRENNSEEYGKIPMLQALALQLLVQVNRSLNAQLEEQRRISEGNVKELINIACKFIEENYTKNIAVTDVADHVFLSTGYFTRAFSQIMGESPMNYLEKFRLNKATTLLKNTDLKINNIARLTGFTTPQRFNSAFRRNLDCTPSNFRRQYYKKNNK